MINDNLHLDSRDVLNNTDSKIKIPTYFSEDE